MKVLLASLSSSVVGIATLGGFVLAMYGNQIERPWEWAVLGSAVLLGLLGPGIEVVTYRRSRPKRFKDEPEIKQYLLKWIGQEGHAVICTRDMSWAKDEESRNLLRDKARRADLTILIPESYAFSDELQELGAKVHTYPGAGWVPTSRFTIIRQGRSDRAVAVGMRVDGRHEIVTFEVGRHHAFGLADDLVAAIQKLQ